MYAGSVWNVISVSMFYANNGEIMDGFSGKRVSSEYYFSPIGIHYNYEILRLGN